MFIGDSSLMLDSFDLKGGWSETVAYIRKIWTSEGPFDGMLGFSQGWGWIWMEDAGISAAA